MAEEALEGGEGETADVGGTNKRDVVHVREHPEPISAAAELLTNRIGELVEDRLEGQQNRSEAKNAPALVGKTDSSLMRPSTQVNT